MAIHGYLPWWYDESCIGWVLFNHRVEPEEVPMTSHNLKVSILMFHKVNQEFKNEEILNVIKIPGTTHYLVLAHSLPILHTTINRGG